MAAHTDLATTAPVAAQRRARSLEVTAVIDETAEARSIVFAIPEPDHALFDYRPGQFLTLRVPSSLTGSVARSYSISSTPGDRGSIKVTVKRTPDGYASNWICDNVRVGMRLDSLPPSGQFTPATLDADLLLCAAGSGITPIVSILAAALQEGSGHIVLYYANRDERSVIFAEQLRSLGAEHRDRLIVLHWLETLHGLPDPVSVRELLTPYAAFDSFLCGPGPFMKAVTGALREAGVPGERIHLEVFQSLTGDPFQELPLALSLTDRADETDTVGLRVDMYGEHHELRWPADVSLLEVLLANDIDADHSCREGECGSCICLLSKGQVTMRRNDVLDAEQLAEGYVLGCQSFPVLGEDIQVVY